VYIKNLAYKTRNGVKMIKKNKVLFLQVTITASLFLSACASAASTETATEIPQTTSTPQVAGTGSGSITGTPENPAVPGGMPNGAPPQGTPPGGSPPAGNPPNDKQPGGNPPGGNPPNGGGGSSSGSTAATLTGAYTIDGKTITETGKTYAAAGTDESAIYVKNGGSVTLLNATVSTSGDSSSSDNSSFYGQNAGVLVDSGSSMDISASTVDTTGDGANGVFASGSGSAITLSNITIDCTGQYAHAVMATLGGSLALTNVDMTTAGASSGAIATDRGSGIITVEGGNVLTTGSNSPGIYSTGVITVKDAVISSSGSEAAVIEGANSIVLTDTQLSSTLENKWGVMIYQSMSGDAEGSEGVFTMTGGSLSYTAANGPLFYVTNSTGVITLKSVDVSLNSGMLVRAAAGNWGSTGANGGTVILTADGQTLAGDMTADEISAIDITLQNGSSLTGAINSENTAKEVSLTLDASSTWSVTTDSHLTSLSDMAGISGEEVTNIIGNGFTIYYDQSVNGSLGGQTYTLSNGGYLKPAG
jgi:hypothetical protein